MELVLCRSSKIKSAGTHIKERYFYPKWLQY